VVQLVPAARHATVLSIPRDLYVPVAGTGGSAKINAAFNHGPGPLVQTIQQSLRIPIHHYLLVNFDGSREVVDALGGIAMYFPRPARDSNHGRNESGLDAPQAGCRRLDGDQALALARSRFFQYQDKAGRWHGDPGTDLGRIRRQQTMLRTLAAKAVGRILANPFRADARPPASGGVVLAAVEAPVDERLDALPGRAEQRRHGQGGRHQDHVRVAGDGRREVLQHDHAGQVGQAEHAGERP
jgi:LCP family protein required for cell wall assembly